MGSGTRMPWFKFQLCHLLSVFLRINLCVLLTVPICKRRIRIHLRGGVGKYRERKKKITPFVPNCIYSGFFLWLVGWFWSPPPEGEETKYISVILKTLEPHSLASNMAPTWTRSVTSDDLTQA